MGYGRGPSLLTIVYLVIGAFIASDHNYFEHVNKIERSLRRRSPSCSGRSCSLA